jgi:hypothetical protein
MKINFRDAMPPMRGCFRMRVYKRGKLVEEYQDRNLIVNGARDAVARLISGAGEGKQIARIAFGTSGNIPTPDDTAITNPFIKPILSASYPETGQVEFKWNLQSGEANGKGIIEFGLLCADGTLYARKIRQEAIPKEPDISLEGEWIIIL